MVGGPFGGPQRAARQAERPKQPDWPLAGLFRCVLTLRTRARIEAMPTRQARICFFDLPAMSQRPYHDSRSSVGRACALNRASAFAPHWGLFDQYQYESHRRRHEFRLMHTGYELLSMNDY